MSEEHDRAHVRQLLATRWVYRTLREVYLEDGHTIVKRFVHFPGRRDRRRVWAREHRALRRLEGLPVPATYGYEQGRCADGPEVVLRKEFIPGEPLAAPDARDARDLGRLLGLIHQRAVVLGDPAMQNFVRTKAGELHAIDFGRAHTFPFRTPIFFFWVGKDFARVFRTAILGRADLWPAFREAHREVFRASAPMERLVNASTRYWLWRWRNRPLPPPPEVRKA